MPVGHTHDVEQASPSSAPRDAGGRRRSDRRGRSRGADRRAGTERRREARVNSHQCLLVASSGGHLLQLRRVGAQIDGSLKHWVTFDTPDARSLLAGEQVTHAFHPTNRNIPNLVRNLWLAVSLIARLRPQIVVSTGAGVGVPFCWIGRLFGARVIFVESLTRVRGPSLSGRLVRPIAHRYLVQWESLANTHAKAEYVGAIV